MTQTLEDVARLWRSRPLLSVLLIVISAVCAGILILGVGAASTTEQRVRGTLEAPSQRIAIVTDPGQDIGINPTAADLIANTTGFDWVIVVGELLDTSVPAQPDNPIPTRPYTGQLPAPINLLSGRLPQPGEAVVPESLASASGIDGPWGQLDLGPALSAPIVGIVHDAPDTPIIGSVALVAAKPEDLDPSRILAQVSSSAELPNSIPLLRSAANADRADDLEVATTDADTRIRLDLASELADNRRRIGRATLGIAALLSFVTAVVLVSAHQRRFGLQRALGASRPAIVGSITAFAVTSSAIGAGIGAAASRIAAGLSDLDPAEPRFTAASITAVGIAATIGAVPPAIVAAFKDPVSVLRSP